MAAAPAARLLAGGQEHGQAGRVREQGAVEERDVHALPLAGALAMQKRGEDALARHEAADRVEHRRAAQRGRPVGVAGHGHDAPHRLHEHVHAGLLAPRPVGAERGQRAVDEPGIQRSQARPVDPEPLGHAAAIGLDHDVGPRDQPLERRAPLGSGQVDRRAALVAVDGDEHRALAAEVRAVGRARGIAAAGLLDLDDVGAHVGQVHAAHGPGDEVGELEHAVAGQGQGHRPAPQSARVRAAKSTG